jgi:hypothetical protein
VGIDLDGPPLTPADHVDLARQFDRMVASGVQSVRVAFSWSTAQPYQSWAEVPSGQSTEFTTGVGGVPTSFAATDEVVALAAARGVRVLPTVLYAPSWDAGANSSGGLEPPARAGPYADYVTDLIDRYGPRGSFWSGNPSIRRRPIRMWQVWNEPNLASYWPQPFAQSYVALLRAAHDAIRRADPGARVVLGALTNYVWNSLGQIYAIRGARSLFDVIAVNGFTTTPRNVILFLQLIRRAVLDDHDGGKPLLATELSWPSAVGKSPQVYDWNTTEAGQARNIRTLLPLLAAQRRALNLQGFYYYTWMGQEYDGAPAFNFAGLLGYDPSGRVVSKPALPAFTQTALSIEGCRPGRIRTAPCPASA